jgi:hypothetical protein
LCYFFQHEGAAVHSLCDLNGDNAGDGARVPPDLGHVEGPGAAAARLDLPDRRRHLLRHLPETGALHLQPLQWRQGNFLIFYSSPEKKCRPESKMKMQLEHR